MEEFVEIEVINKNEIKWECYNNKISDKESMFLQKFFDMRDAFETLHDDPKCKEILDEFAEGNEIENYNFERIMSPMDYRKTFVYAALFPSGNVHRINWRSKNGTN